MTSIDERWIDIAPGFQGYLALPPTGRGPGILLIQEIYGVNVHIRAVAAQYALDGYVVLAPDLFWRQAPRLELAYEGADREQAFALLQRLDADQAVADLGDALASLRRRREVAGKAAVVGYCLGGRLAFLCAARGEVDAAVCYYPGGIDRVLGEAGRVQCPLLFHFAEHDKSISLTAVEAVQATFRSYRDVAVHVYPGAEHGFNCWARGAYRQPSAALAHGRTLSFLATALGSG